jgi:hypothetical protein
MQSGGPGAESLSDAWIDLIRLIMRSATWEAIGRAMQRHFSKFPERLHDLACCMEQVKHW